MPDPRRQKGDKGEDLAARALEKRGYRILARNYRSRLGEIDIIARDADTLVFVEVKTRHGEGFGPPKAAVSRAKQKKMSLVAMEYLSRTHQHNKPARFDVVAILRLPDRTEMEIIKNAFDAAFP